MESSPKFTTCCSILFQCQFATHMYCTNTEIVDYINSFLLTSKELIYTDILLISDGPVYFYQGGRNADGYKRLSLIPLANLFFIPVHSTDPSPTVSEDVQ